MATNREWRQVFALAVAALLGGMAGVAAQLANEPKLHTHQSDMEAVMWPTALEVTDPLAVFAFVPTACPIA